MKRLFSNSRLLARLMAMLIPLHVAQPAWALKPPAVAGSVTTQEWEAYRSSFVDGSGRVIDNANGGISHSEGQGYGLLLAFAAGDRQTFERIWAFTLTEFLIRDDGLAVWKWDPASKPHVPDPNNASDGDILIAYALAKAGAGWRQPRYTAAAQKLAKAIGRNLLGQRDGTSYLLPGATGFGERDRADGPVINLSYWVFEAFPVLASLAPQYDWSGVARNGIVMLQQASAGRARLPTDWTSIRDRLQFRPADGFPTEFGYNAVRIPLYLLRAGVVDTPWLRTLNQRWALNGEGPAVVDVVTGKTRERLSEQGYAALSAALSCALDGTPVHAQLRSFEPGHYYPSTLYLLSMSLLRERYPQCL